MTDLAIEGDGLFILADGNRQLYSRSGAFRFDRDGRLVDPMTGFYVRGFMADDTYPLDTSVPSLGKYLDNTTLFLGKYLGTDLFLELLVQLRASDPVAAPTQSLTGITVGSEFALEWQTPFFMLEWTFFPTDPSSLFLRDNTISFSWEYSY